VEAQREARQKKREAKKEGGDEGEGELEVAAILMELSTVTTRHANEESLEGSEGI